MMIQVVSACPHCGAPIYGLEEIGKGGPPEMVSEELALLDESVHHTCDCKVRLGMTGPIPMEDV